jgi:hypothetical protein
MHDTCFDGFPASLPAEFFFGSGAEQANYSAIVKGSFSLAEIFPGSMRFTERFR